MILPSNDSILTIVEVLSAIGGFTYSILKIIKESKKTKKIQADRIIEECKELDLVVKNNLESRIDLLEHQLHNLEANVAKDLTNLKENHTIELKNLSERIELLRADLTSQHSQIVSLLMKMIP
jgi:hypothetical protein